MLSVTQVYSLLEPIYLTAPIADPPPIPYSKLLLAQGKSPIWLKSSLTDILYFISDQVYTFLFGGARTSKAAL